MATLDEIDEQLRQFWETEEIIDGNTFNEEQQKCIDYFNNTTRRDEDGTYVVSLPFKGDPTTLGNSRRMAMAQFFQMEKKFANNPILKVAYTEYINDLIERGYMKKCTHDDRLPHCYLPHHPVFKDSTTTKVRPVFDASRKTSNGISLNDLLNPGPKIQEDLFNILLRFRIHETAFTADIEKMYLHVRLDEKDQVFQKILWREDPEKPIETYCLTTVTFGVNISPFLAVATVQHHVRNEMNEFPEACKIILNDSYMDDVSSGTDEVEKAILLREQITEILDRAGFPLRKWVSNNKGFLDSIPYEQREKEYKELNGYKFVSTLGIKWFFEGDKLGFKTNIERNATKLTKRSILSQITTIYDPLGLLSPITIYNKIIMQDIWREKLDWDDTVSEETAQKWNAFTEQLHIIDKIKPRRWLQCTPRAKIELHGFSDAAEPAMGANVYIKIYDKGEIHVNLVAAKTKVAPIKKMTIPKLELSAAVLLVKLMKKVKESLKMNISATHFYSDSEITLAWIKGDPNKWKTFVANRVSKIHALSEKDQWHYINTKANPADMASRGLLPSELCNNELWWHGPSVLLNEENLCKANIYNITPYETELEKKKPKVKSFYANIDIDCVSKYSTLSHTVHVLAFCKRFVNKLKQKRKIKQLLGESEMKKSIQKQVLEPEELNEAKMQLIKIFQAKYFDKEIQKLQEKRALPKNSRLLSLNPFLDEQEILRVGGRLENSEFSYNKKHPIIIPYGCHLATLIIREAHLKTMHGGNQLTLCQMRHEYWITAAKRAVKAYINKCVVCHRLRSQNAWQLMGNLPSARTKIVEKAFTYTGTDLCGPIHLRMMANRGVRTQKGYIVIFICLSTRAIHIEIVVDQTAESFIAAFRRFIGRRGHVLHLYCDNGTNFVGANNILKLESEEAVDDFNLKIKEKLATINTTFHFNPSISPWMGGIWERGIGSIKHHLKRTIGNRVLTYEQLSTVLTQIEAVLNSRPISAMSENPEDLDVLTPGHFLIGSALLGPIEPNLMEENENRLSRWQLCTRMKQEFWNKWSNDYLSSLQIRSKWKEERENLKEGDLVLLKEDNMAPLNWPLGRVKKIYPGKDELVRVVEVAAKNKTYKRPIVKLAKLPIERDTTEQTKAYFAHQKKTNQNNELIQMNDEGKKTRQKRKHKIRSKSSTSVNIESHSKADGTKRKQTRKTILCAFVALLAFFSFIPNTNATNEFEITSFSNTTCIRVSKCNNASFINGNWNLITYLDMHEYDNDLYTLKHNVEHLENHCHNNNNSACHTVVETIKRKLSEIFMLNEVIKMKRNSKQKRSAFWYSLLGSAVGFIGEKIAENIFGSSDAHTNEMMKKQISVLKIVNKNMKTLEMENIEHYLTSYVTLTIMEFHDKQLSILKALTGESNKLNTYWISPTELTRQMNKIRGQLSNNMRIIGDNALDIYNIAKIRTFATKQTIITVIEVPLVENKEYACAKLQPIAFANKGRYIKAAVEYEYIFYDDEFVYLMNEKNKKKCLDYDNKVYCETKAPFNNRDVIDVCEYDLFVNKSKPNCNYNLASVEWREVERNEWLFQNVNERVSIKCENKEMDLHLNGSGLLKLKENCQAYTSRHKLMAKKKMTTNTESVTMAQLHQFQSGQEDIEIKIDVKDDLDTLFQEDQKQLFHHFHHYIAIYVIVFILVVSGCYIYKTLLMPEI